MLSAFHSPAGAFAVFVILTRLMWTRMRERTGVRRILLAVSPAAWFAYFLYETYMVYVWEPSVHGPIRLDIVLVLPVLGFLTVISVGTWLWSLWQSGQKP